MRIGRTLAAFVAVLPLIGQATAATLTADGNVLVNRGQGYRPLAPGQIVEPGDSVLLKSATNAQVSFPGGCAMSMPTEGVYTIPSESQCLGAQQQAQATGQSTPTPAGPSETASGTILSPTSLVIGGLALGGIIAGVVLLNDDKSSSP
jgi:hypothetical protein